MRLRSLRKNAKRPSNASAGLDGNFVALAATTIIFPSSIPSATMNVGYRNC